MALIPCAPMLISDFNYELPGELIARYPTADRRGSRLLDLSEGIADRHVCSIAAVAASQ